MCSDLFRFTFFLQVHSFHGKYCHCEQFVYRWWNWNGKLCFAKINVDFWFSKYPFWQWYTLLYYGFPIVKFKIEIADILFRNIYLDFIVYRFFTNRPWPYIVRICEFFFDISNENAWQWYQFNIIKYVDCLTKCDGNSFTARKFYYPMT